MHFSFWAIMIHMYGILVQRTWYRQCMCVIHTTLLIGLKPTQNSIGYINQLCVTHGVSQRPSYMYISFMSFGLLWSCECRKVRLTAMPAIVTLALLVLRRKVSVLRYSCRRHTCIHFELFIVVFDSILSPRKSCIWESSSEHISMQKVTTVIIAMVVGWKNCTTKMAKQRATTSAFASETCWVGQRGVNSSC